MKTGRNEFLENVKLSIKRHKIWTQIVSDFSRLGLGENYPKKKQSTQENFLNCEEKK